MLEIRHHTNDKQRFRCLNSIRIVKEPFEDSSVIMTEYSLVCIEKVNLSKLVVDKRGVKMKYYRKMIEL